MDLVLHLGTGKTGSTSIQAFLHANRQRLAEGGLLNPESPGTPRHLRLGLFTRSPAEMEKTPAWRHVRQSDPERFRKVFPRRLRSEIERSGLPRAVLSDEVLFARDEAGMRRLGQLTRQIAGTTRLVVYLRRQDDHMVSRYQQGVQIGRVVRLREWARTDMSLQYDFYTQLRTWRRVLQPDDVVVRRFEPEVFVDGSLYQDFLDAAGIDACAKDMDNVPDRNSSLDAESAEFVRLVNLFRVENEQARVGSIDSRQMVKRLIETSTGPTLTLPGPTLDEFMSRWEESNRSVAREFLGDETGRLFRTPRKTRNTTTEQRLDPSRVDHFVDLLGLPGELRAPLRRVAEREARIG